MPNPELLIVISAQDAASNVVKGVEKALQDFRAQNKAEAAERKAIRDKETAEYKASAEFRRKVMRQEIFDMQMMASNMQSMGMTMTAMGVAGIAAFVGVAKAAINWETAFTGVRKTVEMTDTEAKGLQDTLRGMALRIPVDTTGLAKIAEIAGQLGIKGKANIEKFTETIARMEVSTNMTAEQAATDMARIATVMGMPIQNIDRMGAAIVQLGNDFNATESGITAMAEGMTGAANTIHMSVPEVLGWATAISSTGVEAEKGGSAISRTMIAIASSVALSDEKLESFAAVAGMAAKDFVAQWKTDPSAALQAFVNGLAQVEKSGGNVFKVLDDLGLSEIRERDVLLRLIGSYGELNRALETQKTAWNSNTALIAESERRFKTLQSQITLAMNAFKDIAITLGESVTPQMQGATTAIRNMALGVGAFAKEHPALASAATLIVGLGSATTLAGGIALIFTSRILQAAASMKQFALMADSLPLGLSLAARAISAVTATIFGPVGLIAGLALGAHWIATTANESRLAQKPLADLELETEALAGQLQAISVWGPEAAQGLYTFYSQAGEAAAKAKDKLSMKSIMETDPFWQANLAGGGVYTPTPSLPKPPTLPDLGGEDAASAAKKLADALASARKQIASMAGDLGSLVKGMNELTNVQDLTALSLEELTSFQSQAQATVETSYEGAQVAVDRAREAILNYSALVSSGIATVDSLAAAEDAVRFAVDNARFSTQLYSDEMKGLSDITDAVKSKTKELADIAAKEAAEAAEKAAEAIRLWNEQLERNDNLMGLITGRMQDQAALNWERHLDIIAEAEKVAAAAQEEWNESIVRHIRLQEDALALARQSVQAGALAEGEQAWQQVAGRVSGGMSWEDAVAAVRRDQPGLGKGLDIITTGEGMPMSPFTAEGQAGGRIRVPGFQHGISSIPGPPSQASLAVVHGREAIIPGDKLDAMIALLAEIASKPVIDGPGFAQSVSAYMQARSSSLSRMGA